MAPITVAIQGERGSFSEEAARELLGPEARVQTQETFVGLFRSVSAGECRFSLVPIENTLAGSVYENYDLLVENKLYIIAEFHLHIVHNLIAFPGTTLRNLRQVFSHPVALAQCEKFFRRHPKIKKMPFYDTAGSVKMLAEQRIHGGAAIASKSAAGVYGGHVLKTHIEDHQENYTRFLLLSRARKVAPDADKVSIVFSTKNVPGALFKCLSVFALREIDLSKLESRPLRGHPWEYLFYVDLMGNINEKRCRRAIENLSEIAEFVRVLGSYKSAAR
jgi:prephenate dehydratase